MGAGARAAVVATIGVLFAVAASCSSQSHPGHYLATDDAFVPFDGGGDLGTSFDVATDTQLTCGQSEEAGILCACTEIKTVPPTLYVLLDDSGSMSDVIEGTSSKWDLIRYALLDNKDGALRAIGNRLAVGAAIFPGHGGGCAPGAEIFPITVGGTATYDALASILSKTKPSGSTPTAASIAALAPGLKTLKPPVYMLLATDGAPNCGTAHCTADRCTYDIEGAKLSDGTPCSPPLNCCDPSVVTGGGGWQACDDADATRVEVQKLSDAGVHTFVLGVPGTELYASDLDALAVAGNEARVGSPRYFAATDRASLSTALKSIAGRIAAKCDITLDAPVSDPGVTNVLVDGAIVPMSATDGWTWTDPLHIRLNGPTCDKVLSGDVGSVQVAVGCKTFTR